MSTAFTSQLRSRGTPIEITTGSGDALRFRVAASDLWETVGIVATADTSVAEVKHRVIAALFPSEDFPDDFVLKLRGWEMLDEQSALAAAGVVNGSILLLAFRRRRPVR